MSKDKSRIKDVWRHDDLRAALEWTPDGVRPERFASSVGFVFEDASVRFAQGGTDGASFVESFSDSVVYHFAAFERAHTFIMAFDDRRYVPTRKAATQASRRASLRATVERRQVAPWHWDGRSAIVTLGPHALPPWDRLRLDPAAYARAVTDTVDELARNIRLPPARRLLIDEGWRLIVVESTVGGRTLAPRLVDPALVRPTIGEADIMAQWYAAAARTGRLVVPARTEAASVRRSRASAHFYRPGTTSVPEHAWQPPHVRDAVPLDEATMEMHTYVDERAPSMLLVTTDTDFVVLSLGSMAAAAAVADDDDDDDDDAHSGNIHVSLGRISLDALGRVCTSTHADARAHREYVDIDRLWRCVTRLHGANVERCSDAAWSFVAFCVACGNDYTLRLSGFSHMSMFTGFKAWLRRRRRRDALDGAATLPPPLVRRRHIDGVCSVALLDVDEFASLIENCYFERLPSRLQPPTLPKPRWRALAALVDEQCAKQVQRRMPDADALSRYCEQVAWSLVYASVAPCGHEHVPA